MDYGDMFGGSVDGIKETKGITEAWAMKSLRSEIEKVQLRTLTATPPNEIVVRVADVEKLFKERTLEIIGGFENTSGKTVPINKILYRKSRNDLRKEQRELLKDE